VNYQYFNDYFRASADVMCRIADDTNSINVAAEHIFATLKSGGTVFWFGNGGSASDAQHLAAELVGRFEVNRNAFASIALNTDTSIITALANDFGYETIFERQIEALGRPGDLVVGISTSGRSPSVLKGLSKARAKGLSVVGFTGLNIHNFQEFCDVIVSIPSERTCHIQEGHIAVGQSICGYVEQKFEEDLV
jgi:D-sedoheptulose 7-phosphate isomerase